MRIGKKIQTFFKVLKHFGVKGILSLLKSKVNVFNKTRVLEETGMRTSGFQAINLDIYSLQSILGIQTDRIRGIDSEFVTLKLELDKLGTSHRKQYFDNVFDLGMSMSRLVYHLCRHISPDCVLETGVAAGMSSTVVLAALEKNGNGILSSVDVSAQVGELIPEKFRHRWNLNVLPLNRKEKHFSHLVSELKGSKLFLHDSDHSDYWQQFEFEEAFSALQDCRYFLFDDVSLFLLNHVQKQHPSVTIFVLNEGHKYSAVFRRG